MHRLKSRNWWMAAGTRAIKTFAQAALGVIGGAAVFAEVNWPTVLSAAGLAAVISLLMSLAGLPEVDEK